MNAKATPPTTHEEPEPTQEESVPSDGKDRQGEEMMKKVDNPRLDKAHKREQADSKR